tara:strand:+ start:424 stop:552 length:129 start_codon:yes stop_codon:yes gene_type:complete
VDDVANKQSPIQIEPKVSGSPAIDNLIFFSGADYLSVVDILN